MSKIPKEILRDAPCTDEIVHLMSTRLDEILNRTFISRAIKSPSPSTTDSSSIVSNSEVTDFDVSYFISISLSIISQNAIHARTHAWLGFFHFILK